MAGLRPTCSLWLGLRGRAVDREGEGDDAVCLCWGAVEEEEEEGRERAAPARARWDPLWPSLRCDPGGALPLSSSACIISIIIIAVVVVVTISLTASVNGP